MYRVTFGYRRDLVIIQRANDATGSTFDVKIVAMSTHGALCDGDAIDPRARVLLHCGKVGASQGYGARFEECSESEQR